MKDGRRVVDRDAVARTLRKWESRIGLLDPLRDESRPNLVWVSWGAGYFMTEKLLKLIERARKVPMTPQDIEEQRISFAYGNAHYENPRITREMVARYPSTLTADEMREGSRS